MTTNQRYVGSPQSQALTQPQMTNPELHKLTPVFVGTHCLFPKNHSSVRTASSLPESIAPVLNPSTPVTAAPIGYLDVNETIQAIIQRGHEDGPDQRNVYTNNFQRPSGPFTSSVPVITSSAPMVTMASLLPSATVSGSHVPVSLAPVSPVIGTAAPISVSTGPMGPLLPTAKGCNVLVFHHSNPGFAVPR